MHTVTPAFTILDKTHKAYQVSCAQFHVFCTISPPRAIEVSERSTRRPNWQSQRRKAFCEQSSDIVQHHDALRAATGCFFEVAIRGRMPATLFVRSRVLDWRDDFALLLPIQPLNSPAVFLRSEVTTARVSVFPAKRAKVPPFLNREPSRAWRGT